MNKNKIKLKLEKQTYNKEKRKIKRILKIKKHNNNLIKQYRKNKKEKEAGTKKNCQIRR